MIHQPRTAVIIPAYNEARTLRAVVDDALPLTGMVVVIDDGSTDGTAQTLRDLPVRLIRHERNLGKSRALAAGFREALDAGAELLITLDGDGQHRPRDIPALLAEAKKYPEAIVIGSRLHERDNIPVARYRANCFANFWISWAAGYAISDSQSGFRVYPADILRGLLPLIEEKPGFVLESEILILAGWRGIRARPVPVPAIYPETSRPSHFRPVRDIALITKMVARCLLMRGWHWCRRGDGSRGRHPAHPEGSPLFEMQKSGEACINRRREQDAGRVNI